MKFSLKYSGDLYHARTARGFTPKYTSDSVDIDKRWYQHLEKGTGTPSLQLFLKLGKLFDLDLNKYKDEVGVYEIKSLSNHKNKKRKQ